MLIVVCCVVVRLCCVALVVMFALIVVGVCNVSYLFASVVSVVLCVCLRCVAWFVCCFVFVCFVCF